MNTSFAFCSIKRRILKGFFTNFFAGVILLILLNFGVFVNSADSQKRRVPNDPFLFTDANTGKTIPEVLILPLYYKAGGIIVLSPKVTGTATVKIYFKHPFIYKNGGQFNVKKPNIFVGLPLLFVFIGKFSDIRGTFIVAPGYKPVYTDDLWDSYYDPTKQRELKLTPVSEYEWNSYLQKDLKPFAQGESKITENCRIWQPEGLCEYNITFKKDEKKFVQTFLTKPFGKTK